MIEKLQTLEKQYQELSRLLADPELPSKPGKYRETAKNHAELQEIVEGYQRLKEICRESASVKRMLEEEQDEEILSMARQELQELERQKGCSEEQLRVLLLPKDPNDEKNAILVLLFQGLKNFKPWKSSTKSSLVCWPTRSCPPSRESTGKRPKIMRNYRKLWKATNA